MQERTIMSKFPSQVITIDAISDKANERKAGVKSTSGIWFDLWKDFEGEATPEYNQLLFGNHNEPFKKGDTVIISVKEGEWNGKKQYTIKSIFPAEGTLPIPAQNSSATGQNNGSQRESSEAFGLRLAIHGMVNGLLAGGKEPSEVSVMLPELFGLEEDIEKRLAKPASLNVAEAKITKANEGTINPLELFAEDDQPISVEDIPF